MASFFDTLFGGGAEKEAAQKDIAALNTYQGQALPALQQGYDTGTGAINSAIGAYSPLATLGQTYSGGANTLMNALGVNGPQGNAAATSAFQTSPGYDFTLGQGLDALARRRGNSGMGQSGNSDIDAMTYATGLANQNYQQWINNLGTAGQMGLNATGTAAAGQAGGYTNLANLAQQYAQNQTGVYGNVTQGTIGANNLQAAGEAAGAKNLLGAGLSLATLGMGGGLSGLGGLLGSGGSSLGQNLFGSSPSYGGGNFFNSAWGGSSSNPLPGLTAADYGLGY